MPRNYNVYDNSGGTNMVGRAYTPQVAPWNRMDDDVSVQPRHDDNRSEWRNERQDRQNREYDQSFESRDTYRNRDQNAQDPYYRNDLVPGYGDGRVMTDRDRERDDRHRAGHRAHWENRDSDHRYQYNDYQPTDDRDVRRDNLERHRDDNRLGNYHDDHGRYANRNDRDRQTYERSDYDRNRDDERYAASGRDYWRADDDRGRPHRR